MERKSSKKNENMKKIDFETNQKEFRRILQKKFRFNKMY